MAPTPAEPVAGILLTGGQSRRMGTDKATLPLGPGGETLARHLAHLLESVASPSIEAGPGVSGLAVPTDPDPGEGPLAGLAVAVRSLWAGAVPDRAAVVLATDLPFLTERVLGAIARHGAPASCSVVPMVGGRRQPLCARWSPAALANAVELAGQGERRIGVALSAAPGVEVDAAALGGGLSPAELERALTDVDDPDALAAYIDERGSSR